MRRFVLPARRRAARDRRSRVGFESLESRRVCSVTVGGDSWDDVVLEGAPALTAAASATAPTAVPAVTAVRGDRSVSLSWRQPTGDGGSGIFNYLVQFRSQVSGTWSTWQTVNRPNSTALGAVVNGLVNGRPYLFRVAAVNAVGQGRFAQTVAPVTPLGIAQAPTSLTATAATGRVTVRWGGPADTGGGVVKNFQVEVCRDLGGSWSAWTAVPRAASTVRQATIAGLPNGLLHAFRVRAVTAAGPGAWSTVNCIAMPTYFVGRLVPPSGWVHRDGPHSSFFMPSRNWQSVDSQYGLSISSPTGLMGVDLAIVRQSPGPLAPRQVVEMLLSQAIGPSYQITRVGSVTVSGLYTQQEFEWTGISRNPNGNFAARGVMQANVFSDPWSGAYGYFIYNMSARTDLWAGALTTLQTIRANMRRMR